MFEAVAVTSFPAVFLVVLFASGERFRRRQIDMDGDAPIRKGLFYGSKYLIVVVWAAMVLDSWGVSVSFFNVLVPLKRTAFVIWALGFIVLFVGRFTLGSSFRMLQRAQVPARGPRVVPARWLPAFCRSPPRSQ